MTFSPPSEAPHYQTKALTPESPVPLHVPESLPVLQNQNDIAFNQMSKYMEIPGRSYASVTGDFGGLVKGDLNKTPGATQSAEFNMDKIHQETHGYLEIGTKVNDSHEDSVEVGDGMMEVDTLKDNLISTNRPSMPLGASEPPFTNPQPMTYLAQPQTYNSSSSVLQDDSHSSERSYVVPVSQGPDTRISEVIGYSGIRGRTSNPDVNHNGVDYQALPGSVLSPASTTPPAGDIPQINTAPSSISNAPSPSNAQTPIATLPVPAGLPPRPPPQEKPTIHPNYTPGEDIRSYHNPPPQNSNVPTSFNAQPSSSYRPPQGYPHSNGVAPNGLPPPPLATFQQPMSKPNQPQRSPQNPQYRQTDSYGTNGGKPASSMYDADDGQPKKPDVEKRYEEYLHDEEIYVSEGTWDRFPQGSRLFVGELQNDLSAAILGFTNYRNR